MLGLMKGGVKQSRAKLCLPYGSALLLMSGSLRQRRASQPWAVTAAALSAAGEAGCRSLGCQARDGLSAKPDQGEKHRVLRAAKRGRRVRFFWLLFLPHSKKSDPRDSAEKKASIRTDDRGRRITLR
jgi:hypothetical protein